MHDNFLYNPGPAERQVLERERSTLQHRMPHLTPYDARRLDELNRVLGPPSIHGLTPK